MNNSSEESADSDISPGTSFTPEALSKEETERCHLYVELGISFPSHCSMSEQIAEFDSADLFVHDGNCLTKVSSGEDNESGVYIIKQETCSGCVCHEFDKYDCPPKIEEVEQEQCIVSCHLPNRERLRSLIEDLKSVSERVRLLRIVEVEQREGGEEHSRSLRFDLTTLTEIQRKTLELAVTNGYYDDPQTISLAELAEKLDITKSALSRRIKRAEANLVSQIVQVD
jgi:predicted DNA binding protein